MHIDNAVFETVRAEALRILRNPRICAAQIARQSPTALTFTPVAHAGLSVKLALPGAPSARADLKTEHAHLTEFAKLGSLDVVLPQPLVLDSKPDMLVTTQAGRDLTPAELAMPETVMRMAKAAGAFAASLFNVHGAVHMGLSPDIMKNAQDKIGICDLLPVFTHALPERMFVPAVLGPVNFAPAMAEVFTRATDYPIDRHIVENMARAHLAAVRPMVSGDTEARMTRCLSRNIAAWGAALG